MRLGAQRELKSTSTGRRDTNAAHDVFAAAVAGSATGDAGPGAWRCPARAADLSRHRAQALS